MLGRVQIVRIAALPLTTPTLQVLMYRELQLSVRIWHELLPRVEDHDVALHHAELFKQHRYLCWTSKPKPLPDNLIGIRYLHIWKAIE